MQCHCTKPAHSKQTIHKRTCCYKSKKIPNYMKETFPKSRIGGFGLLGFFALCSYRWAILTVLIGWAGLTYGSDVFRRERHVWTQVISTEICAVVSDKLGWKRDGFDPISGFFPPVLKRRKKLISAFSNSSDSRTYSSLHLVLHLFLQMSYHLPGFFHVLDFCRSFVI